MTADDAVGQREQWRSTFRSRPDFLGAEPSDVGRAALARFRAANAQKLLELGPGQGRDTLLFAQAGMSVTAVDYAQPGLDQILEKAVKVGLADSIHPIAADARAPLPLAGASFDAVYAHMLLCMSLTTEEVEGLIAEVRRVLRPGGLFVYSVRNTSDAHYRAGVDHGDDRWETAGFVVHFFDRALIDRLTVGFDPVEVVEREEGKLPRRLFVVTMRKSQRDGGMTA